MNDIRRSYMKLFGKEFIFWIGFPSFVILVAAAFGIRLNYTDSDFLLMSANVVPYALMLLTFWVGMKATERAIMEDRKRAAQDFYTVNTSAAIDRAFRRFWRLLEEGRLWKNATAQQRQEWERKVITAMRQYCNEGTRSIYLLNTGRHDPEIGHSIKDDKYDAALEHIEQMLHRDFGQDLRVN